jgi:hypothetical protein
MDHLAIDQRHRREREAFFSRFEQRTERIAIIVRAVNELRLRGADALEAATLLRTAADELMAEFES